MRVWVWSMIGIVVAVLVAAASWLITAPALFATADLSRISEQGDPERGRLVFAAGDCASCHASPGQPDRLHLGGGLALASRYGTFRAPNISMDPIDGIGKWTARDLANALLNGVSPVGSHYYPVFPYASFTQMRVEDVQDLMAYLRTLPAVSGRPPGHELNLLFGIRRFVGFWKLLYFRPGPMAPDPAHDERWNRGRYLAEALAHCAECHSSRDMFGGIKSGTRYAGGQDPEGAGFYPNITPERLGDWSEQQLADLLKTGATPNHGRVGASMSDVITNLAMLPDSDRQAIANFVKSLPSRPTAKP
ncbi:c-type cytochrome [Bradyrhizobium sp. USDA 4486]